MAIAVSVRVRGGAPDAGTINTLERKTAMELHSIHSAQNGGKTFYTVEELAARWHCTPQTVRGNWRRWGLRGARFGKRLIFSNETVLEVERRQAETTA